MARLNIRFTHTSKALRPCRQLLATYRQAVQASLVACATLLIATAAQAREVRYVAFGGDDANPCTRLAPCATLQRGIDATPDGGEVQFLTAGEHTPVTIARSITISADGVPVTVQGVVVNGTDAVVTLRGLLLNGTGSTSDVGVKIGAAQAVHIVRCEIQNFQVYGILHYMSSAQRLYVSDSIVHNNLIGLSVRRASGPVSIDNSRFIQNLQEGLEVYGTDATIIRSLASANNGRLNSFRIGYAGIVVAHGARAHIAATTSTSNGRGGFVVGAAEVTLESSTAAFNKTYGFGFGSKRGETARISNLTLTNNATGVSNGSVVLTRRNNTISGNTTDFSLNGNPLTPIGGQ